MQVRISFFTIVLLLSHLNLLRSQTTVPSTCVAHDSIIKKYRKDAGRLALRHTVRVNSSYKDSINIDRSLSKRYLAALIAVHNATALPIRDTLIDTFRIHTDLAPELNLLNVKATPTLNWMQQLQSSSNPTSNPTVNNLLIRYSMQFNYYLSSLYDMVIFSTDSNVNMQAMANVFMALPGVVSANPELGFNDVRNITDSLNPNFVELTYSIGWGTCADGCDFRHYWPLKVYNDCSVEYTGSKGTGLFLGLNEQDASVMNLQVFPNPVSEKLFFTGNIFIQKTCLVEILTPLGQIVSSRRISEDQPFMNVGELSAGMYFVRMRAGDRETIVRIVKE